MAPPCMLRDVDLSSNALNGTLPQAFLASCGELRFLNMSRNSLTGGGFPFPLSLSTRCWVAELLLDRLPGHSAP
ncbi:hypothetical protein PR202_ga20694 [Eleusine coracana subsp. coracana]|uniref:Uncharacterized protein n=1 Tax=Eleusine coracana subsp. coracana TaxID=191504 RepID=A0AAV5CZ95_ELECO|nr:hypothetical protein PR202_ga20694 [Eleusine coracana subsp. coracana]